MERYLEMTGRTEEIAISAALEKLGLDRDDVSVEILERAKSGFLGIGNSPAKVRVTYEGPDEPAPAPEPAPKPEPRQAPKPAPAPRTEAAPRSEPRPKAAPAPKPSPRAAGRREDEREEPAPFDPARAEEIRAFLAGLLTHMEIAATPTVGYSERGVYEAVLEGGGGALIGRRGETLDAIQQLTGYAANRGHSKRVRVHVDAEGYRARREQALEDLARRVAERVVRTRREVQLEPMNAYERHVVHTALQDVPDVSTHSVGAEPNRRTVVTYTPGKK